MKIITNNRPRYLLAPYEMPVDVLASEFGYVRDLENVGPRFFKYRGAWYDSDEFMRCPKSLEGWHGYQAGSFFSGTLLRYCDDYERVIVATYLT